MTCFEKVMAALTAIYVVITGFYAGVSFTTLRAIKKQGVDTAKNAEAAQIERAGCH
jgi:hypothetical protein